MGLEDRVSRVFTQQEMLPAACQGILAVQAREGMDVSFLREFHHASVHIIACAERSFVAELNGGCSAPIAAFATIAHDQLTLEGLYQEESTRRVLRDRITGPCTDAVELGRRLARRMREEAETR